MKLPTEPNSEEDFDVTITDDGTGARVIGYKGKSGGVYIPATIQGLPVKEVEFKITATEPTYVNALVVSDGCEKVYVAGDTYKRYESFLGENNESYYVLRDANREIVEKIAVKGFELGLIKLPDSIIEFNLEGTAITEFEVPASVKVVGWLPATLEKVSFRGVPEEIGRNAFPGSKLTSIVIPEGVEVIGESAFARSKNLKTVTLPEGVKTINAFAFKNCSSLESVTLPSTLKTIGMDAFYEVSTLKELIIPESINSIEFLRGYGWDSSNSFKGCSKLNLAAQARLRKLGYDGDF